MNVLLKNCDMEFASLEEYAEYYCSKRKMSNPESFIAGYNMAFNALSQQQEFEIWKICLDRVLANKGIMQSFIDKDTRESAGKSIRHLTEELFSSVMEKPKKSKNKRHE